MSENKSKCEKCGFEGYAKYFYGTCALCYRCFVNMIERKLIREFLEDLERQDDTIPLVPLIEKYQEMLKKIEDPE